MIGLITINTNSQLPIIQWYSYRKINTSSFNLESRLVIYILPEHIPRSVQVLIK